MILKRFQLLSNTMRLMPAIMSITTNTAIKTYEEAVVALNNLQSNAATLEKTRQEREKFIHRKLIDTAIMAARANVTLEDIDRLSMIHVSGTKGKGSTCAFTESILRHCGYKTGFFSSPHLVEVRERIRINGRPLSKELFTSYFWDVYTKLDETKAAHDNLMPPYFKFLTIMAFHVFLKEKVDVAIMEVGIGGQYDCTNILRNPVVCGVSSLDLDHVSILGDTIEKIAWQKGGIFKPGAPAFTVAQPKNAIEVLRQRSIERQCPLYQTADYESFDSLKGVKLAIAGEIPKLNAALALQLSRWWIENHHIDVETRRRIYKEKVDPNGDAVLLQAEPFFLESAFIQGLENCCWPGRNQVLKKPKVTYYIDGAHTPKSIEQCADWFHEAALKEEANLGVEVARVLLFNVTGERSPASLLKHFVDLDFDACVFCPNIIDLATSKADSNKRRKKDQENMMVTKNSQLKRCTDSQTAWTHMLSNKAYRPSPKRSCDIALLKLAGDHKSAHQKDSDLASISDFSDSGVSTTGSIRTEDLDAFGTPPTTSTLNQLKTSTDFSLGTPAGDATSTSASNSTAQSSLGTQESTAFVFDCISEALQWISTAPDLKRPSLPVSLQTAKHVQVLCTGSVHLVGGILAVLDPELTTLTHNSASKSEQANNECIRQKTT